MRLLRVGPCGAERPGVWLDDDHYLDLSAEVDDFDEAFFEEAGLEKVRSLVAECKGVPTPFNGQRIGAPVARPHQILCIGLNYSDHAKETGQDIPAEPIVFTKSPNTLVGPSDEVIMPRGAEKLDWEVELAIVVGSRAEYLESTEEAERCIAGYMVVNDISERAFQLERGGQWCKGKSAATFNPAGPWLVTADEVPDVGSLALWLDVNGSRRQTGNTSSMIFNPATVVQYLSQFMVLEPGDIINTGTPPGVGMGLTPPVFLQVGDVMELGIDGLGSQRQEIVGWRRS